MIYEVASSRIWKHRKGETNSKEWFYYIALIILFMSADLRGSGSAIARSVSTCLSLHIDFRTYIDRLQLSSIIIQKQV